MKSRLYPIPILALLFIFNLSAVTEAFAKPLKVKAVIVTAFQTNPNELGEFKLWAEHENLNHHYTFPIGFQDIQGNDQGVIGIVTGEGKAHASSSIIALGLDPRFDLKDAYWLIAGIGGVNPHEASIGSACWINWVVDGDLSHEIDAREIPADWPTGYLPVDALVPYGKPTKRDAGTFDPVFHLNEKLVDWAYQFTKDTPLEDTEQMKKNRVRYIDCPNAQKPPYVLKGDVLGADTFWHGKLLSQRAHDWVSYYTQGAGNYVMTDMEDSATMAAFQYLSKAGKINSERVLILRTASNFDSQPPGYTASQSLAEENEGSYSGFVPSLDAAYRVGNPIIHEIVNHWDLYQHTTPGDTSK